MRPAPAAQSGGTYRGTYRAREAADRGSGRNGGRTVFLHWLALLAAILVAGLVLASAIMWTDGESDD